MNSLIAGSLFIIVIGIAALAIDYYQRKTNPKAKHH